MPEENDEETAEETTEQTTEERFPPDENFPPDSEQIYAWNFFPDVPF